MMNTYVIAKLFPIGYYADVEEEALSKMLGKAVTTNDQKIGVIVNAWVEDMWVMAEIFFDQEITYSEVVYGANRSS